MIHLASPSVQWRYTWPVQHYNECTSAQSNSKYPLTEGTPAQSNSTYPLTEGTPGQSNSTYPLTEDTPEQFKIKWAYTYVFVSAQGLLLDGAP